ncbi:MAG: hypothetical protein HYS60_01730 [Candidatus Wildermuthbacteria bacterium]|nr:hypothetical protein [Candidatus Wildermuthbacteria bacterium]
MQITRIQLEISKIQAQVAALVLSMPKDFFSSKAVEQNNAEQAKTATVSKSPITIQETPTKNFKETVNQGYTINVLVLKYFPLTKDGNNINSTVTRNTGSSYGSIWQKTIDITDSLKTAIEQGSRYLGYSDSSSIPSLSYVISNVKRFEQAIPAKGEPGSRSSDYSNIFLDLEICKTIKEQNIKEIWIFSYLEAAESYISGTNGVPKCETTYFVYAFNYTKSVAEALQTWSRQFESELEAVDKTLFRDIWQGPLYPQTQKVIGRCGSPFNPPNARYEKDFANKNPQKSDCLDWKPNSIGTISYITCALWNCDPLQYAIWNWQNLPGRGNTKTYQGKQLRNWWDIHGDFDNVMSSNKKLTL